MSTNRPPLDLTVVCKMSVGMDLKYFYFRVCVCVSELAGSLAGGRGGGEGAAGEGVEHQEEQRLQRGASQAPVNYSVALTR